MSEAAYCWQSQQARDIKWTLISSVTAEFGAQAADDLMAMPDSPKSAIGVHRTSSLGGQGYFQALGDFAVVLIGFHRNALNVHPYGRSILVIQDFARLDETAGLFGDEPRVGVPRLIQTEEKNSQTCTAIVLQNVPNSS